MAGLELDPDLYQLYQQLQHGGAHLGAGGQVGAAAFFQSPAPPQPQPPMLGLDGQWAIDPAGYVAAEAFSAMPQPMQVPGGGVWAGDDGGFVPGGGDWAGSGGGLFVQGGGDWAGSGGVPQGQAWTDAEVDSMMLGGDAFLGNDQLVHGGDVFMGNDHLANGGGVPGAQDLMLGGDAFLGNDQLVHGGDVFMGNDHLVNGGGVPGAQDLMLGGDAFLGNDQLVHGGDVFMGNDHLVNGGGVPGAQDLMLGGDAFLGNDQLVHGGDVFMGNDHLVNGGGVPGAQDLMMGGGFPSAQDLMMGGGVPGAQDLLMGGGVPGVEDLLMDGGVPGAQDLMMGDGVPGAQEQGLLMGGGVPGAQDLLMGGDVPGGQDLLMGGDVPGAQDLLMDGSIPGVQDLLMSGVDLSKFDEKFLNSLCMSTLMNSLAANEAAADPSVATKYAPPMFPAAEPNQPGSDSSGLTTQVGGDDSPGLMSQMPAHPPPISMDCPQQQLPPASLDAPQAVPDDEKAEVAVWSEEENQALRDGLSRYADQDNVTKCFSIAAGLTNKTVLDVAYRIRWLSDLEKKKAAKQAQLEQENFGGAKVTKGKGSKSGTRKNNKYPLSKEVLNSKSAKELIRDNDRLMYKIEEILKTGQVKNCPDYFYYVKMNMDAMRNKVRDLATVMEGFSVKDDEWEDVLKDRSSS